MKTDTTLLDNLRTSFDRLRAAQLRHTPDYQERMHKLDALGHSIRQHREAIVQAISDDFGRRSSIETLAADIMTTLGEIRHTRRHLRQWMQPQRRTVNLPFQPAQAKLHVQPLGVVGIIAPWNYPFQLAVLPLVNAIAAGNRVMVKPSEFTPRVSALLAQLLSNVFSDEEVVVVQGDAHTGAAFTQLPFDHLLFTGSTTVGRHVMAAAATHLTPVTLELGGKSPVLIAPDYPIAHAAERVAFGKCFNAGQTCVAPDYVLVPRTQRDEFARAYLASVARRYPNMVSNPDYTAIINTRQAERLRTWLDDAHKRGVTVLQHPSGGETAPANIEIIPPTVLLDPPDDALVMQQEIFGPLLPVKSYDRIEEAIAYILSRDRPLAFYPFDHNRMRLSQTLERIVAGSVCVNDTLVQFGQDRLPIGGVGASGMGRYHGHDGFLTFSKQTPVFYQSRLNGMTLFDPPYSTFARWVVKWLAR